MTGFAGLFEDSEDFRTIPRTCCDIGSILDEVHGWEA
jgi:hypothetical protein